MAALPDDLDMSQIIAPLDDSSASHGLSSDFLYDAPSSAYPAPVAGKTAALQPLPQATLPSANTSLLNSSSASKTTKPPAAPRIQMGRHPRPAKKDRGPPPPVAVRGMTPTTARNVAAFNAQLDAILNSPGLVSPLRFDSGDEGEEPASVAPKRALAGSPMRPPPREPGSTPHRSPASGRPQPNAYGAGVLVTPATAAVLGGLPADAEIFFGEEARVLLQRSLGLHSEDTRDGEPRATGGDRGRGSGAAGSDSEYAAAAAPAATPLPATAAAALDEDEEEEGVGDDEEPESGVEGWAVHVDGSGASGPVALDASLTDVLLARALAQRDAALLLRQREADVAPEPAVADLQQQQQQQQHMLPQRSAPRPAASATVAREGRPVAAPLSYASPSVAVEQASAALHAGVATPATIAAQPLAAQPPRTAAAASSSLGASALANATAGTPLSSWLSDDIDDGGAVPQEGGGSTVGMLGWSAAASDHWPTPAAASPEAPGASGSVAVTPAWHRGAVPRELLLSTAGGKARVNGSSGAPPLDPHTPFAAGVSMGGRGASGAAPDALLASSDTAVASPPIHGAPRMAASGEGAGHDAPGESPDVSAAGRTPTGSLPDGGSAHDASSPTLVLSSAGTMSMRLAREPASAATSSRRGGLSAGLASAGSVAASLHMTDLLASRSARLAATTGRQPRRLGVSFADSLSGSGGDAAAFARRALLMSRSGSSAPLTTLIEGGAVDEHDGTLGESGLGIGPASELPEAAAAEVARPPAEDVDDFVGGAAAAAVMHAAHAEWADDQRFVIRAQQLLSAQPPPASQKLMAGPGAAEFDGAASVPGLASSSLGGSMAGLTESTAGAAFTGYTPFFAARSEPIEPLLGESSSSAASGPRGRPLAFSPAAHAASPGASPTESPDRELRGEQSGGEAVPADAPVAGTEPSPAAQPSELAALVPEAAPVASASPLPSSPSGSLAGSSLPPTPPVTSEATPPLRPSSAQVARPDQPSPPEAAADAAVPPRPRADAPRAPAAAPPLPSPTGSSPSLPSPTGSSSSLQVPRSLASLFLRAPLPVQVQVVAATAPGGSVTFTPVAVPAPPTGPSASAVRLPLRNAGQAALAVHISFAKVVATLECPGHGVAPVALDVAASQGLSSAEAAADDARWAVSPPLTADPAKFAVSPGGVALSIVQLRPAALLGLSHASDALTELISRVDAALAGGLNAMAAPSADLRVSIACTLSGVLTLTSTAAAAAPSTAAAAAPEGAARLDAAAAAFVLPMSASWIFTLLISPEARRILTSSMAVKFPLAPLSSAVASLSSDAVAIAAPSVAIAQTAVIPTSPPLPARAAQRPEHSAPPSRVPAASVASDVHPQRSPVLEATSRAALQLSNRGFPDFTARAEAAVAARTIRSTSPEVSSVPLRGPTGTAAAAASAAPAADRRAPSEPRARQPRPVRSVTPLASSAAEASFGDGVQRMGDLRSQAASAPQREPSQGVASAVTGALPRSSAPPRVHPPSADPAVSTGLGPTSSRGTAARPAREPALTETLPVPVTNSSAGGAVREAPQRRPSPPPHEQFTRGGHALAVPMEAVGQRGGAVALDARSLADAFQGRRGTAARVSASGNAPHPAALPFSTASAVADAADVAANAAAGVAPGLSRHSLVEQQIPEAPVSLPVPPRAAIAPGPMMSGAAAQPSVPAAHAASVAGPSSSADGAMPEGAAATDSYPPVYMPERRRGPSVGPALARARRSAADLAAAAAATAAAVSAAVAAATRTPPRQQSAAPVAERSPSHAARDPPGVVTPPRGSGAHAPPQPQQGEGGASVTPPAPRSTRLPMSPFIASSRDAAPQAATGALPRASAAAAAAALPPSPPVATRRDVAPAMEPVGTPAGESGGSRQQQRTREAAVQTTPLPLPPPPSSTSAAVAATPAASPASALGVAAAMQLPTPVAVAPLAFADASVPMTGGPRSRVDVRPLPVEPAAALASAEALRRPPQAPPSARFLATREAALQSGGPERSTSQWGGDSNSRGPRGRSSSQGLPPQGRTHARAPPAVNCSVAESVGSAPPDAHQSLLLHTSVQSSGGGSSLGGLPAETERSLLSRAGPGAARSVSPTATHSVASRIQSVASGGARAGGHSVRSSASVGAADDNDDDYRDVSRRSAEELRLAAAAAARAFPAAERAVPGASAARAHMRELDARRARSLSSAAAGAGRRGAKARATLSPGDLSLRQQERRMAVEVSGGRGVAQAASPQRPTPRKSATAPGSARAFSAASAADAAQSPRPAHSQVAAPRHQPVVGRPAPAATAAPQQPLPAGLRHPPSHASPAARRTAHTAQTVSGGGSGAAAVPKRAGGGASRVPRTPHVAGHGAVRAPAPLFVAPAMEEADAGGRFFSREAPGRSGTSSSSTAREAEGFLRVRSDAASDSEGGAVVGATDAPGPASPMSPPRASAARATASAATGPRPPAPLSPASAAPPLSVHTLRTPASRPARHDARSPVTQNFTLQQQQSSSPVTQNFTVQQQSLLPHSHHAMPHGGWDSMRGGGGGRGREPQPFAASTPAAAARPASGQAPGLLLHETAPLAEAAAAAAASVGDWGGSLSPVGAATRLAVSPVADDASDGGAGSVEDWGGAPEAAPAAVAIPAPHSVAQVAGGALQRTPSPDHDEGGGVGPPPRRRPSLDSLDLPPPPARPSLHGGQAPAASLLHPVVADGSASGGAAAARHSAADSIAMGAPGTSAIRAFTAVAAAPGGPRAFSAAPSGATRPQPPQQQRPLPPPPPHDLTAAFDVPVLLTPAARRWDGVGEPSRTPPATRPPAPSVAWFIGEESRTGSAARPPQPPPWSGSRGGGGSGGGGAQALHRLLEGSGAAAAPLPPSSPGEEMRLPRHPPVEFFSPPPHTQAEPPRWFVHPASSSVDVTAAGAAGRVTVINRADTPLTLRLGLPASAADTPPLLALRRGPAATVPPHTESSVELLLALPDLLARDPQAAAAPAAAWSVAAPQSGNGEEEEATWEWSAARRSLLGVAILVSTDAGRGGPLEANDACAVRVAIHEGAWQARGWRFEPALQALVPAAAAPARAAPAPPVEGPAAASRVPHKTPARALPETPWPPSSPPQPSDDASALDASLRAAAALTIVGGSMAGEASSLGPGQGQQGGGGGGPPGMYFSMRTIYFPPTAPGATSRVRIQLCNTSGVAMTARVAVVPPGVRLADGVPMGATRAELAAAAAFHVKRPHRSLELRPRSYCMLPVTFAPPAPPAQRNGESSSRSSALLTPPSAAVLVVEAVPVGEGGGLGGASGLKTSGRAMLVGELLQG